MVILQVRGAMIQKFSLKDLEVKQALFKERPFEFFSKVCIQRLWDRKSQLPTILCRQDITKNTLKHFNEPEPSGEVYSQSAASSHS